MSVRFMSGDDWNSNCHHCYNKTSSTEVLHFNNFGYNLSLYGKMAAIMNMKIEQNYSKDIFNESISQNLHLVRNNESNIKYLDNFYYVSVVFIQTTLQPKVESPFCYSFFDTVYHSIPFTQCCLS